jgi:L-alanine-DL-glutamate epimerase-like enolase superfamily enzyme
MTLSLSVRPEAWPLKGVFRISRGARTESEVVVVELADDGLLGRGECSPYGRYSETLESVAAQIESVADALAVGADQTALLDLLPAGAARNAVDCALWDLQAKRSGTRAWQCAGLAEPKPITTAYTLGVDTPEAMGAAAHENKDRALLKLKMTGDGLDLQRVAAIHAQAPGARLIVDANEAWDVAAYQDHAPKLAALGVEMIEQPLPAAKDAALLGLERPVTLCADESCHDTSTLGGLVGKYDMINIKLDKTGGLTEALRLRDAGRAAGFQVMIGCMVGTSLAMAPGVLVAQGAEIVDLDGPLLMAKDREPALNYEASLVHPPTADLWG